MNITQDDINIKQAKVVETVEIHKYSKLKNENKELIDKLYIRAEYRNVFINQEMQVFYIENGNQYIINLMDTLDVDDYQLNFLIKIYPFATLSVQYIKMHIEQNFEHKNHFSILNKYIQASAMDKSKIYVTTKTKDLVRKHLSKPYIITNQQFMKLNQEQKKIYKINAAKILSKRNEQHKDYIDLYQNVTF
jgi:hypothetical protein